MFVLKLFGIHILYHIVSLLIIYTTVRKTLKSVNHYKIILVEINNSFSYLFVNVK